VNRTRVLFLTSLVITAALTIQLIRVYEFSRLLPINQHEIVYAMPSPVPNFAALPEDAEVLVIYSEEDEGSRQLHRNVRTTLAMARVNASYIDVAESNLPLRNYSVVVIATEQMARLSDYAAMISFVRQGGKVVFLIRSYFHPFNAMTGMAEQRGFSLQEETGVHMLAPVFPGKDGLSFGPMLHSLLDVTLLPTARVLAETPRGTPLIWVHRFGEGEVLYINSNMMKSTVMRGMLLQCIAYLPDYFVSTIFNALVFNIDDFPAPIRFGRVDSIYNEYFIDAPQFFQQIWWPDTHNFARRHHIKFTGLAIATFNADTTSPIEPLNPLEKRQLTYFGRRLSELGGELGIHGYNHQSLALPGQMLFEDFGYVPWESLSTMEEGLRLLRRALLDMFGEVHIFSYVPPSNIVSREGRIAVRNIFPEVRIFAGVYTGDEEPGLLLQEFGRDPYVGEVVSFPRLSAGYLYQSDSMWAMYSGVAHYGLVHHFIHPDDLLDPVRSGGHAWEEMDRQINAKFAEIRRHFPFLRAMTLVEAYQYFVQTEGLRVHQTREGNKIKIHYNQVGVPVYHLLRLRNEHVASVSGGSFQIVCPINRVYLISGDAARVEIDLRR